MSDWISVKDRLPAVARKLFGERVAFNKGYRISPDGQTITSPLGATRKPNVKACGYLEFTVRTRDGGRICNAHVTFHRLQAYQKYGERIYESGLRVQHLDGNPRNNSEDNIVLGAVHGMSKTKVYKVWVGMMARCLNENSTSYARYGGRGIKVCHRWVGNFSAFIADMGERPPGTSIERINNDGDYCPENCRWATRSEQGFNTRRNRIITFGGESLPLNAWAVKLGINSGTLRSRIDREGWDVKSALTIPVRKIKVSV